MALQRVARLVTAVACFHLGTDWLSRIAWGPAQGLLTSLQATLHIKGLLEMMFDVLSGWIDDFIRDMEVRSLDCHKNISDARKHFRGALDGTSPYMSGCFHEVHACLR